MRAQIAHNVVFDRKVDSIGSEATKHDHFSERIFTFGFPFAWQLSLLRLGLIRTEPVFPFARIQSDCLGDAGESGRQLFVELDNVVPRILSDPILARRFWQSALVVTH